MWNIDSGLEASALRRKSIFWRRIHGIESYKISDSVSFWRKFQILMCFRVFSITKFQKMALTMLYCVHALPLWCAVHRDSSGGSSSCAGQPVAQCAGYTKFTFGQWWLRILHAKLKRRRWLFLGVLICVDFEGLHQFKFIQDFPYFFPFLMCLMASIWSVMRETWQSEMI